MSAVSPDCSEAAERVQGNRVDWIVCVCLCPCVFVCVHVCVCE